MSTYTATTTMINFECGECGQLFGMSEEFQKKRFEDHKIWYCPNGCQRHYPAESDKEKLRRHLSETQEEVNRERGWRQEAESQTETVKRQRNALVGHARRAAKDALSNGWTREKINGKYYDFCPSCSETRI